MLGPDLETVGWLLNSESLFASSVGLPNGTYDIAAIAIDKRGAIDSGPSRSLTVSNCQ